MSKLSTQGFKYFNLFKNYILRNKVLNTSYLKDYGFKFNDNLNLNLLNNELQSKIQNMSSLNYHYYLEDLYHRTIYSVDNEAFEQSIKNENSSDIDSISDINSIDEFVEENKDLQRSMIKSQSLNGLGTRGLNKVVKRGFSDVKKGINAGGSFESLVTKSSIFIDKSLFIKTVIEDDSDVILITMPRRWGKSRNLEMLKRFLSISEENDQQKNLNKQIFSSDKIVKLNDGKTTSLNITKEVLKIKNPDDIFGSPKTVNTIELQGQFPVIAVDFKDCKGKDFEDVRGKLEGKILKTIKQFAYLSNSSKTHEEVTIGESYKTLLEKVKSGNVGIGLQTLSELLHTHHEQKTWILIDEYDAAANKAYLKFNQEEAQQVAELFRSVYEPALKENPYLEKGVMTGVQYIVKSGMLSGLNNLRKYNVTSPTYSKYYGVNEEEMKMLTDHFEIDSVQVDRIKDWYNGYKENIGTDDNPELIDKYNIWSVVNYLNNQREGFKSYWEKSGSVSELIKPLFKNSTFKNQIEDVINGHNLYIKQLKTDFDLDDFVVLKHIIDNKNMIEINKSGIDLVFSYLFITGYLTIQDEFNLRLPNKELKKEFSYYLQDYYDTIFNIDPKSFLNVTLTLNKIFEQNNKPEISKIFTEEFAPKLSSVISELKLYGKDKDNVNGVFANEDMMHSLLNNIAIQVVNARFASERRTTKTDGSKGRADMVVEKNGKGIVIEMKYNAKDSKAALSQAKTYNELLSKSDTKIFVGCNITDKQEVFLSGEITDGVSDPVFFEYP